MERVLENLRIMKETPNYGRWIFELVEPYIGRRILEVGCGIGNITGFLTDRELVIAMEPKAPFLEEARRRFKLRDGFELVSGDICSEKILGFSRYRFDTVLCINVLEHLKDDSKALRNIERLLRPGGRLILVSPAIPFLFGTIDESDGHYRRYTRGELMSKVSSAGMTVGKIFYANLFGILIWAWHSKVIKHRIHPLRQMRLLDNLVFLEKFLERFVRLPIGLSLVCIAGKL